MSMKEPSLAGVGLPNIQSHFGNAHKLGNSSLIRRNHRFCFEHAYEKLDIKKGPPKRGIHHMLPNDIPYIQGNAVKLILNDKYSLGVNHLINLNKLCVLFIKN